MEQFTGTGVALVTPFDSNGQIDFNALETLVEHQIENNIDYLVVLGTTAETPTLTALEQKQVTDKIVSVNKGRLPVVLGVGGNHTAEVVSRLQSIDPSVIDAVLSVSPYYNKPSQEGIYRHFEAIVGASPVPVILYNVPSRTGSNMEPETVHRLARDFDNIIGIKEAAGNFEQILELIRNKPEGFHVISGEDKLALPLVLAGGAGVISVIGQAYPEEFSEIINSGLQDKAQYAYSKFYELTESIDLIFEEGNPVGIKSMLQQLGICNQDVRLPLTKASENLQQKISRFVVDFKLKEYVI